MWVNDWDTEDLTDVRLLEHGLLGHVQVQVVKLLNFDCLVTLDSFGRPEALEITRCTPTRMMPACSRGTPRCAAASVLLDDLDPGAAPRC